MYGPGNSSVDEFADALEEALSEFVDDDYDESDYDESDYDYDDYDYDDYEEEEEG